MIKINNAYENDPDTLAQMSNDSLDVVYSSNKMF